jgi:formate-dependent nitrite reductase cytochrome c552 subunit
MALLVLRVNDMSFARKLRRKQQQKFFKDFKKSMKKFKRQVSCSKCGYVPVEGEKIDDWHIDKYSESIDLICTSCYNQEEKELENV